MKFFLHISEEEPLERFKDRIDDPERHWKIAISQIIVETMERIGIKVPEPTADIAAIREKYHAAVERTKTKKAGDKK